MMNSFMMRLEESSVKPACGLWLVLCSLSLNTPFGAPASGIGAFFGVLAVFFRRSFTAFALARTAPLGLALRNAGRACPALRRKV